MNQLTAVLSITGSDSTGGAGIHADIRTITALGGFAVTAISSITVQDNQGIKRINDINKDLVLEQVRTALDTKHPKAVKVGMLRDADTVKAVRDEVIRCKNIVLAPGITSSQGERLLSDDAINVWKRYLIPEASIILLKCNEAEILLNMKIATDDDMLSAARKILDMGAECVFLRGGKIVEGQLTGLLCSNRTHVFVSSRNTDGWQKHGVGGALSSAIATRLAMGDDLRNAISKAHTYMHSQVVYAVSADDEYRLRSADIYNQYMSLIADKYKDAHDVQYYADKLNITTRYLTQITDKVVGRSPKQLIADYLMREAQTLLETTRLTIQEISNKLGFSSQSSFSKFFFTQRGCSPTEYRSGL